MLDPPADRLPDPRDPASFQRAASALWDARRFELLREFAGRRLAEFGRDDETFKWLAFAAVGLGRTDDARQAADERVACAPDDAGAHFDRGQILEWTAAPGEAEAAYRRALELAPHFAACRARLADLLLDEGRAAEGLAEARAALEIDPSDGVAYVAAVRGAIEIDAIGEARRLLDAAPEGVVGTARYHAVRGDLLRRERHAGAPAAAVAAFSEALRLDPTWSGARTFGLYAVLEAEPTFRVVDGVRRACGRFGRPFGFFFVVLGPAFVAGSSPRLTTAAATAGAVFALLRASLVDPYATAYLVAYRRERFLPWRRAEPFPGNYAAELFRMFFVLAGAGCGIAGALKTGSSTHFLLGCWSGEFLQRRIASSLRRTSDGTGPSVLVVLGFVAFLAALVALYR